jgi:quercetin dioxygenase-like cupin family protein
MQAIVVLHGEGHLETAGSVQVIRPGDTLLFPASMPAIQCRPRTTLGLLLATLPSD